MDKDISFSWDEEKNKRNIKKHSVSFEEALTVFCDEEAVIIFDDEHSASDDRVVMIGTSSLLRTLVVCHSYREETEEIRIISARKANSGERKQYEESLKRRI